MALSAVTSAVTCPAVTCPAVTCPAGANSQPNKRETANEHLQNVFTAVLQQAGQQGYLSAEPLAEGADLPQQIGDSWHEWFNQFSTDRFSAPAGPESPSVQSGVSQTELRDGFQAILLDAYAKGGYAMPQQYLQSLSKDQLKTVQQVHHLANAIDVASLSSEGSLNLLLPPGAQVDADHNGLTAVGAGLMLQFPNSDTPKQVRHAWDAAIESVPEPDRLTYQMQMMLPLLTANLKVDENGQFVRSVQPGDPDWSNPMSSAEYSYHQAATDWLSYLDRFKNQMSPERYSSDTSFWTKFRDAL